MNNQMTSGMPGLHLACAAAVLSGWVLFGPWSALAGDPAWTELASLPITVSNNAVTSVDNGDGTTTIYTFMGIIDPLFTLPILIGVLWALARGSTRPARIALAYAFLYLGMSVVQHARVMNVQQTLAQQRGHEIARGRVMPTFANQIVWRSLYESDGMLHADAVRVPLFGPAKVKRGESVALLHLADLAAPLKEDEYVRSSLETFSHFADGYISAVTQITADPVRIGDMRYSLVPEGFAPMWGIAISRGNPKPTAWPTAFSGDRDRTLRNLWREILDDTGYESVTLEGE